MKTRKHWISILAALSALTQHSIGRADDGRIASVQKSVDLIEGNAADDEDHSADTAARPDLKLQLFHIATAKAPTLPGDATSLQATSFAFQGSTAYVTYDMAGDPVHGAIDVLDLSDPQNPRFLATDLYSDEEFNDVRLRDGYGYFVGATAKGNGGAVLKILNLAKFSDGGVDLPLSGHQATSIELSGNTAMISVGDNEGIVYVDISQPSSPRIIKTVPLANSLSAIALGSEFVALGGDLSTDLYFSRGGVHSIATLDPHPTAAPGRMKLWDSTLYTNAGHTGLSIYSLSSAGNAQLEFHTAIPGTGNGIDVASQVAFLAQGEKGVQVYETAMHAKPILLGHIDFNDQGSANNLKLGTDHGNHILLLSDGLGGFKILGYRAFVRVKASKHYLLPSDEDGHHLLRGTYDLAIPTSLAVAEGNAGDGEAVLKIGNTVCHYQGGSACPTPLWGTDSWNKGLSYLFKSCENGAQAGEVIANAQQVDLHIESGDWLLQLETEVHASLEAVFE